MYEFLEETVQHNMTSPAKAVAPEMTVGDLLRLFSTNAADAYPVECGGRLVGIVSKADALTTFALKPGGIVPHYDDLMATTVDEIMSRQVMTVDTGTRLQRVLHLMGSHRFKTLPVVDNSNRLKGMITREQVIRALARSNRCATLPPAEPAIGHYAIA